jgi:hypothetical protein
MRKIINYLTIAAIALGFAACNNEDVPNPETGKGNTYVGVTLRFAQGSTTRALPGDHNPVIGGWKGRDKIEDVTVFLVSPGNQTIDFETFYLSQFHEIDANGVLKPKIAVKATPNDNVDVYVVVNGNNDIITTLKNTSATNFETAFTAAAVAVASEVATYDGVANKETVMMTNTAKKTINVAAGVTEEQAKDPNGTGNNHAQVEVERVVARTMLTVETKAGTNWQINRNIGGVSTPIAEVTGVQYGVGQSNRKFYIMKKSNYVTPENVYSYVPAGGDWATQSNTLFDYSGLNSFTNAQEFTYDASNTAIGEKLNSETTSKFVLPVTHTAINYKKGNTTYVEIRAKFKPLTAGWGDTEVELATLGANADLFLGANGLFYSSEANATNPATGGVANQKVKTYTGSIMKYVLWLNPGADKLKPTESPTVRNQIYHIHISSFKEIGLPENPIDPNDPDDPDNPIDPEDPLVTEKTYLSVSIKVLNWNLHSYTVDLGNNY